MSGFSKDSTAFLKALAKNNDREWFADHKADYEMHIKRPAQDFALEMTQALERFTGTPHKTKIFRIYRDVRFSKDKTPYNTHVRISFIPDTGQAMPPGWFFSLELGQLILGAGVFGYQKQALDDWRNRVAGDKGAELAKQLDKLEKSGHRIGKPDLKRVPSGFDTDHPRADLLRYKGLTVWRDYADASNAIGDDAPAKCLTAFKPMKPVFDWMLG